MIEFKDVRKAFGPKKVLNGLSLKIPKGERFFILGRSGTGKSVLLKHLVGLLRPDSGNVVLEGEHLENSSEKEFQSVRRKCSLVFQLPALLDSLNLFENLVFGVRTLPLKDQVERSKSALEAVELSYLWEVALDKYPPQLSYGEQKRIALARSLVIDPDYILYDEPTTGLDPATARSIHELIRRVSDKLGKTSVVVSHDMENAIRTASRIAILDAGNCVFEGTPEEVLDAQIPIAREFLKGVRRK